MRNGRKILLSLWLTVVLVGLVIFAGCRAFEPEAVIVNKAPETYIIGAPPGERGRVLPLPCVLVRFR